MTTMTESKTTKQTAAYTILQRSVCLTLSCHYLGNHRKVDMDELVEMAGGDIDDAAEQQLRATKKLIDSKELAPAHRVLGQAKRLLSKRAIKSHRIFGERTYLIPLDHVEEVDEMLTDLAEQVRHESAKLAGRYRAAVEAQREALGPLFREKDYMEPWQVAKAFSLDWSYVSFAAPENLETVSHALARASQKKHEAKLAEAFVEWQQTLRATALKIMRDLVARLGEGKDGKPKAVRGTALNDVMEFVSTFRTMNQTDDDELAGVVDQMKALVSGVDVEDVRKYDETRAAIVAEAGALVSKLEVLSRTRALDLD